MSRLLLEHFTRYIIFEVQVNSGCNLIGSRQRDKSRRRKGRKEEIDALRKRRIMGAVVENEIGNAPVREVSGAHFAQVLELHLARKTARARGTL